MREARAGFREGSGEIVSGGLLGGERVYASERCARLMTGDLFDELQPL
jgi:hypothetical protein